MKSRGARRGMRQGRWAALFLAPSALILLAFSVAPMASSLWTSLHRWNLISPMEWAGLDSYKAVLTSERTWTALRNTGTFVLGYVPLVYLGGFSLAVMLHRRLHGRTFFRSVYFLPVVTSWVVVALVWKWLLSPNGGIVNTILGGLGLPQPGWWTDPKWAMFSVVLASAWKDVGLVMVIMLAGLQAVPVALLDAAAVDGAGAWQRFRSVTFPLVIPTSVLAVILSMVSGFQVFDQAYVMSYGTAASGSVRTLVLEMYDLAFRYGRAGEAAALSWLFFILLIAITLLQLQVQRRSVHEY